MPTPHEPAVGDADDLFVRVVQRGKQDVLMPDAGQ